MFAKKFMLVAAALVVTTAFIPGGNALNVSDGCDDNTTTFGGSMLENTIMPLAAAAFPLGGNPTPGQVGGNRAGGQSTPAGNVPVVEAPVQPLPAQTTVPRFHTNWTPDCVTIQSGQQLTWTNGDAEAVHGIELGLNGSCIKSPSAFAAPLQDKDIVTLSYNAVTGTVTAHFVTERVANTAAPGTLLTTDRTVTCDALALALKTTGTGASKAIDIPGIVVDEEAGVATLSYMCFLHHASMTGTVKIQF